MTVVRRAAADKTIAWFRPEKTDAHNESGGKSEGGSLLFSVKTRAILLLLQRTRRSASKSVASCPPRCLRWALVVMARRALELAAVLLALAALAAVAAGGDIVHQDDEAPKIPGCSNDFVLVWGASCLSPRKRRS
jgi:hypothetical protein